MYDINGASRSTSVASYSDQHKMLRNFNVITAI